MFAVLAAIASFSAFAEDTTRTVSVHTAHGNDALNIGIHTRMPFGSIAMLPGSPQIFVDGGLALWRSTRDNARDRLLADLSAVAGLRWRPSEHSFIDASLGPHVLSRTRLDQRRFGINLQFGSKLSAGFVFGDDLRHEVAAYIEHVSNGSLASPNKGMTFYGAEYRYAFR